ncbi:MAG: acyltransferase family protein [Clostridiales bacterium]|nr:acyltransferase family protein [Clostridiales bacterium]
MNPSTISLSRKQEGQETQGSDRILYFDYLESLAIFFVVSIHRLWLDETVVSNLSYFLWRTAVPLFFMVHGALMLGRDLTIRQSLKRTLRIFLQLIAWMTIYLVVSFLAGRITLDNLTLGNLYRYYINTASFVNEGLVGGVSVYHLWFTYALIFVYLCLPIVSACLKQNPKLLVYIAAVCAVFSIGRLELSTFGTYLGEHWFGSAITVDTLFNKLTVFGQYRVHLFYFIVGYLLAQWVARQRKGQLRLMLLSGLAVCAGLALMLLEYWMEFGQIAYGGSGSQLTDEYNRLGVALAAMGLFVLFSQIDFEHCPLNRFAVSLSKNTLGIYYLHMIFLSLLCPLFQYKHPELGGVAANYGKAVVVLALAFAVSWLLHRIPLLKKLV